VRGILVKQLSALAVAGAMFLAASAAAAQTEPARPSKPATRAPAADVIKPPLVKWDPRWPRFRTGEYIATGILAATAFASLAIPVAEDRWTTVNGFDAAVRDSLRLSNFERREDAKDASDVMLTLLVNQLLFDNAVVVWWGHGRGDEALELTLMDIEALAFTGAVNGLVAGFASRERPYRDRCDENDARAPRDCTSSKRYRSYFSGHTSTSFTAAGLTCMHHAYMPIYGGGAPDVIACGMSFMAAAAVGAMRVISDQHFASDVLTGAAIGTLSGLGLPWLLHYREGAAPAANPGHARRGGVSLQLAPTPMGGYLMGAF
jgi:membrane-associated phospholipid phosphatase